MSNIIDRNQNRADQGREIRYGAHQNPRVLEERWDGVRQGHAGPAAALCGHPSRRRQ